MSENNVGTVNPDTDNDTNGTAQVATTLDAEQLEYFLNLAKKDKKAKERAAQAKEDRKRANGRPLDADGNEIAAPLAFFMVQSALLSKWTVDYADNPTRLFQRLNDQYIPMIVSLSNTPSSMLAGAYDSKRRDMEAWMSVPDAPVPAAAPAPAAGSNKKQ